MTEDLISRKAAIDAIYACYIGGKEAVDKAPANDQYAEGIDEAVCAVEQLPSVTPQPCDDAISKGAVLDALRARFGVDFDHGKWWSSSHVLAAIESVPSVTPQEPKTGHWVRDTITDLYHCSACRYICRQDPRSKDNYCSYCGARMVEPEEGARRNDRDYNKTV